MIIEYFTSGVEWYFNTAYSIRQSHFRAKRDCLLTTQAQEFLSSCSSLFSIGDYMCPSTSWCVFSLYSVFLLFPFLLCWQFICIYCCCACYGSSAVRRTLGPLSVYNLWEEYHSSWLWNRLDPWVSCSAHLGNKPTTKWSLLNLPWSLEREPHKQEDQSLDLRSPQASECTACDPNAWSQRTDLPRKVAGRIAESANWVHVRPCLNV